MSTTELLEHVLDPFVDCLTPDAARKIASLRAEPDLQRQFDELADRANEGLLTQQERDDYERLRAVFHMVTLLQSKARKIVAAE